MTALDPTPAPTCPNCGTNTEVAREADQWLCTTCWTIFTGSADEWKRHRRHRDLWRKRHQEQP